MSRCAQEAGKGVLRELVPGVGTNRPAYSWAGALAGSGREGGHRSYGASRKVLVRKMEETILPVALIVPSLSELDSESLLPE